MPLNELQAKAVDLAVNGNKRIFILRGGPGTGKTTTIREIVAQLEAKNLRVQLAAPTGKAARRMMEQTRREASTIHRLLEPEPFKDADGKLTFDFSRDENRKLELDVLIVDECSMLEIPLAWKLIRAIPRHARTILVGDTNQLPPVGPGAFFIDLIAAGTVPSVELTQIMRQDARSKIVPACHRVKDGRAPRFDNQEDGDLFLMPSSEAEEIAAMILDLVDFQILEKLPDIDRLKHIQVIAPTREKGPLSCAELNKLLQGRLNPVAPGGKDDPGRIRIGDKVIQTKNDYELNIVNGDIGFVRDLFELTDPDSGAKRMMFRVEFEDTAGKPFIVDVPQFENNLELAYAITCHKFQGSEAPAVVIPIHNSQPSILMQRAWVYTALSRARSLCVVVGEDEIINRAVRRQDAQKRRTHLAELMRSG